MTSSINRESDGRCTDDHHRQRGLSLRLPAELARRVFPPRCWPRLDLPTPFLVGDLAMLRDRFRDFRRALPGVHPFFAVKCNSTPQVLAAARQTGRELRGGVARGASPAAGAGRRPARRAVQQHRQAAGAHRRGRRGAGCGGSRSTPRASCARSPATRPGVRCTSGCASTTAAASSRCLASSGRRHHDARGLMHRARGLGLRPYGITFHVGSQCTSTPPGCRPSPRVGRLMRQLLSDGIRIEMLDIGGGFPARYGDPVPAIEQIGIVVNRALQRATALRPRPGGRRTRQAPGRRDRGAGRRPSSGARYAPARSGSTSTSAPTTG